MWMIALLVSAVYCAERLFNFLARMWPRDVGVTLEARTLPMEFPQASIIPKDDWYEVQPFSTNEEDHP